jgi:hypothetical protein
VLHTDEAHPHVHAVVKAVSEQGIRLNIRKSTLREWRRDFARHLRAQGIEANATERAVRGEVRINKIDGIYRAQRRGVSTHIRSRVRSVAAELANGNLSREPGKARLLQTNKEVVRGWRVVGELLNVVAQEDLARDVERFTSALPSPRTEREQIADVLLQRIQRPRTRELSGR